jgi:hypothetical protein
VVTDKFQHFILFFVDSLRKKIKEKFGQICLFIHCYFHYPWGMVFIMTKFCHLATKKNGHVLEGPQTIFS